MKNDRFQTPTKTPKNKKNSTRVCTIQSVSSRERERTTICNHNYCNQLSSKKTKRKLHLVQDKLCYNSDSNVKKTKTTNKIMRDDKKNNHKNCSKIDRKIVSSYIKKQGEFKGLHGSSDVTSVIEESEEQQKLPIKNCREIPQTEISVSLATNQLINQMFENRKSRIDHKMQARESPKIKTPTLSSQQAQIHEQSCANPYRYSILIPKALKTLQKIPHLTIRPQTHLEHSPHLQFIHSATQYRKQSKKKWQQMHTQLQKYLQKCENEEQFDSSRCSSMLLSHKIQKRRIYEELRRVGQRNYRWFQFLENLEEEEINYLEQGLKETRQPLNEPAKKDIQENKEVLGEGVSLSQQKQVECKIVEISTLEKKEQFPIQLNSELEVIEDDSIGQMFSGNYNFDIYALNSIKSQDIPSQQHSSGTEEDLLDNPDFNTGQTSGFASFYEKQSEQSSILRVQYSEPDDAEVDEECQLLEQKTDITLNWLIDEFVIQLASQLNLDLFLGLEDNPASQCETAQQKQSKILNQRIQQMYRDCDQIDKSIIESAQISPFIRDALEQTSQLFQFTGESSIKYKKQICEELKQLIITRKDLIRLEIQRKKQEKQFQKCIRDELVEEIFDEIVAAQIYCLCNTFKDYIQT